MTQFSLFGAEAGTPSPEDLGGLLVAGGHWVRSAAGARLSVVVADRWRAEALAAVFAQLELGGTDAIVDTTSGFGVRTAFSDLLNPQAVRWTRGANEGPPAGFELSAGGLRLWAIAAGRRDDMGYLLATADADSALHRIAGAQLSRLGVAAVSLVGRGGPGWRVTSSRRLRRLVELLGVPPPGGEAEWADAGRPT